MTDEPQPRPRSGVLGRAWADLPLRAKGLVVVAIPLLALPQDRRAQGAVLHTVEVERQIAQVRILVQAGVTGYVLTGERRYLTSYQEARQELPRSIASLGALVSDNPGQADRVAQQGGHRRPGRPAGGHGRHRAGPARRPPEPGPPGPGHAGAHRRLEPDGDVPGTARRPLEQEYRFLLQDGYRWLLGVTRLVYDDDGTPTPSATSWT